MPRLGRIASRTEACQLLADYGNRIPNITAEITFHRTAAQPFQLIELITTTEGGYFSGYPAGELAIHWRRGHGWFLESNIDPALAGIRRFSLRTMQEDRQARMSDITDTTPRNFPGTLFCGADATSASLVLRGGRQSRSGEALQQTRSAPGRPQPQPAICQISSGAATTKA